MSKGFPGWIKLKEDLHENHRRPLFKEREVWWCHVGANVGREIDGRGANFVRPVLVVRKFSRDSFYGLPLTTTPKQSAFFYRFTFKQRSQAVNLSQLRLYDAKRLSGRMGTLPDPVFAGIKGAFVGLL